MKHPLRDRLLDAFPDTKFIGPIVREYDTGYSGADVFAARFGRADPTKQSGLKGIFLVKIEHEKDIEPEKFFHQISYTGRFSALIASLRAISDPIDGFVAVAYDVAFQDFGSPSLASILAKQATLSVKEVTQQIESLCSSLVDLHLEIDNTDNIDINKYSSDINTYYHLLYLMLGYRLFDIKSRLKTCLPDWPQDTLQINFMGHNIINPLRYVELDIWEKLKHDKHYNPAYYLAPIHGDPHTENIICHISEAERKTSTKTDKQGKREGSTPLQPPKFIDFGQSRDDGIPLSDLAYLELDIIRRTMRVDNEEYCDQWFYLLDHIMGDILPGEEVASKLIKWDTTDRTLEFIYPIRRQVKRWLDMIRQEDPLLADSLECVWWLAIIATGLNFARKGDNKDIQRPQEERKAALLYAAYGLASLYRQLGVPVEPIKEQLLYVSWTSQTATPQPETDIRERYQQALREHIHEREELDVVSLHINESMIDNRTKWLLTQIFVWPNVIEQRPNYDMLLQQDQMSHSHRQTGNTNNEQLSAVTTPLSLATVLAQEKQLLLFGDAGMGKSTILRYLRLQMAHPSAEFTAQLPRLVGLVPVFIELEDYANKIMQENAQKDIPISKPHRRLQDFISFYLQENYPEYRFYIEQQIKDGNVLFLFADLDTIADAVLQDIVAQDITNFTYFHRQNHFIVTSRPIAFRGASLYKDYTPYALTGFTDEQIQRFLTQWLQVHNQQAEQVKAEVNRLWQVISRDNAIRPLVTTPLFLTIFALKQSARRIAFGRNEFFAHCKELLLSCKGRKNERGNLPPEILCEVIYTIAFWMHEQDINKKPVSRDDLTGKIESVLKAHNGSIQPDADPYIEFMRKKAGILRKCSAEHFDFTLEPIKEYLAAVYIAAQEHLGQSYRHKFIEQHLHSPHWREVLRHVFAILLSGKTKTEEDVERAVADFRGKGMLLYDLIFIGQYLVDNPGHATLEEETILSIGYHYLRDDSDELRKNFAHFLRSLSETPLVKILKSTLHYVPASTQPSFIMNSMDPIAAYKTFIHKCLGFVYAKHAEPFTQLEENAPILRIRTMMLLSLFNMQSADWGPMTIELLNRPDESVEVAVKQAAIMLLGILGKHDEQARERLLEALEAPERSLRSAASNALSQLAREKQGRDIPTILLTSLVHTCSAEKKVAIINTLALIGDVPAAVLDQLIEDFPRACSQVQQASVKAAGEIARLQAAGVFKWAKIRDFLLIALANDEDPAVRSGAALSIKMLASKEEAKQEKHVIIKALLIALSDPDSQVKANIAQALECFEQPLLPDDLLPNDYV